MIATRLRAGRRKKPKSPKRENTIAESANVALVAFYLGDNVRIELVVFLMHLLIQESNTRNRSKARREECSLSLQSLNMPANATISHELISRLSWNST